MALERAVVNVDMTAVVGINHIILRIRSGNFLCISTAVNIYSRPTAGINSHRVTGSTFLGFDHTVAGNIDNHILSACLNGAPVTVSVNRCLVQIYGIFTCLCISHFARSIIILIVKAVRFIRCLRCKQVHAQLNGRNNVATIVRFVSNRLGHVNNQSHIFLRRISNTGRIQHTILC